MKRQTGVRQSFLNSAPLLVALFSILVPGRLIALDLDLRRVGGYDTSGYAVSVAVSGNYAYVADEGARISAICMTSGRVKGMISSRSPEIL
jgi:hypothetical protein